tara:strand:+ start:44810 stop:45694 length:885 start_codon:yes stop_codon:yes gene_type:complete
MQKFYFYILTLVLIASSCDDGDIIVTSFDFEDSSLESCGSENSYVFFKINGDAQESLSASLTDTNGFFYQTDTVSYTLDGTTNFVNYRKYSDEITSSYFCSSVPPTSPLVTVNYLASSGTATITTTTTLDDNDGIDEVADDSIDTDGDGIPDYYDFDDDGDNVPTAAEIGPDPLNPKNTDAASGDTIPDYLDPDDDGDGVLTRDEENFTQDLNPTNDITDASVGPDFLNPAIATTVPSDQYRPHNYNLNSDILLVLTNLVLINENEQITQEFLDMGGIESVRNTTETVTPVFND